MERNDILYKPVRIEAVLADVRTDEIDPRFMLFVIDCGGRMAYAAEYVAAMRRPAQSLRGLVGARVRVDGVLNRHVGFRVHSRRYVSIRDDNAVLMVTPPSDMFAGVPEVGDTGDLSPEAIVVLGHRRATGRVLAVWNGDTILMRAASGEPMKVELVTSPPFPGDAVEVAGYAETDLFHINLANACVTPCAGPRTARRGGQGCIHRRPSY